MNPSTFDWAKMKNIQKIHRVLYAIGLGPLIGRIILLLTTTGRRSGMKRVTPLQYEMIQSDPQVEMRVGAKYFCGTAEVVTDPSKFADFMEVRLERHPRMIGLIMQKAHGLPKRPSREQLEDLAKDEVFVIVHPTKFSEN